MTELEKLQRARDYADKIANGIDPITDEDIPQDSLLNHVRMSRYFFYVRDVLDQVLAGELRPKRQRRVPFEITAAELANVRLSESPIGVSEIAKRINAAAEQKNTRRFSYSWITNWLLDAGYLEVQERADGRKSKRPTEAGEKLGIFTEQRTGPSGEYTAVLYDLHAQRFLMDNMDAILQLRNERA